MTNSKRKKQIAAYYLANRTLIRAQQARYRIKNRLKIKRAQAVWVLKNRRRDRKRKEKWEVAHRPQLYRKTVNYRHKHRDKYLARLAVSTAISRGKLKKKLCAVNPKHGLGQAHHWRGYSKKHRLDVQWLCKACHARIHRTPNSVLFLAEKILSKAT